MSKLSIIIPVHNEEKTIQETLNQVSKIPLNKEILVIDDGSTDNTLIKIISFAKNMGKGAAVREGINQAKGDYIVIQDGDLEYNPEDLSKLLQSLSVDSQVVYGSRLLKKNPKSNWLFHLGGRSLSWITNLLFGTHLTDVYTCYKLFPTEIAKSFNLTSNGFEIEAELTAKALKRKLRIKEVPISYHPRLVGKKIKFMDWIKGVLTLFRIRFSWNEKS
jgi:glycosyltransferase involved in cell wall biosynthesis